MLDWRQITDWAKKRPVALQLADALGRGRRRFCVLDRISSPASAPYRPDLSGWDQQELAAVWIGHGTVLLRIGGMTVLTDPVFSSRVGLDLGLMTGGPRRLVAPALQIAELPAIDLVLVSHAHFDHLDRPSLDGLPRQVPVITSEHNADLIADLGFLVQELRWGQSAQVGELKVTAWPVRHWGARTFYDIHRGFCAFLIESSRHRILFGGDSAFGEHFRDVGGVDLAVLGIGAYDPYIQAHSTPEQTWAMADHARAENILPIHHHTFRLSHEPTDEPIARFHDGAGSRNDRIALWQIGQTWIG